MDAPKHVLVATDFGDLSAATVAYGRALARTFHATLHVVHVAGSLLPLTGVDGYSIDVSDIDREMKQAARKQLDTTVTADDRRRLRATTILLTSNTPALAVAAYAEATGIDLIVLGSHGGGLVHHLFVGSIAERLLRVAPCPVLIVRQPAPRSQLNNAS